MNRYEVTFIAPGLGPVKHVIKANSKHEAAEKAKRAHPGADGVVCKPMKEN